MILIGLLTFLGNNARAEEASSKELTRRKGIAYSVSICALEREADYDDKLIAKMRAKGTLHARLWVERYSRRPHLIRLNAQIHRNAALKKHLQLTPCSDKLIVDWVKCNASLPGETPKTSCSVDDPYADAVEELRQHGP